MNGRPGAKRLTPLPAADAPMVVASAAIHELFLSLQAGGFTTDQALTFCARYLAFRQQIDTGETE